MSSYLVSSLAVAVLLLSLPVALFLIWFQNRKGKVEKVSRQDKLANAAREEVRTYLRGAIKVLNGDGYPQGSHFLILCRRLHDFKYDMCGPYAHSLKEATATAVEIQSCCGMNPEDVVEELIAILYRLYRTNGYLNSISLLERVKVGVFLENWLNTLEVES